MVPNAPKWYETQQNLSLVSNGVDRVRSLQKILTRIRGTNISQQKHQIHPIGR